MTNIYVQDYTYKQRNCDTTFYTVEQLELEQPHYAGFNNVDEQIVHMTIERDGPKLRDHWAIFLQTIQE